MSENDNPCAFSEVQSFPFRIERPARFGRGDSESMKSGDRHPAELIDSAGNDQIAQSGFDPERADGDRICTRCTGIGDCCIGTGKLEFSPQKCGRGTFQKAFERFDGCCGPLLLLTVEFDVIQLNGDCGADADSGSELFQVLL